MRRFLISMPFIAIVFTVFASPAPAASSSRRGRQAERSEGPLFVDRSPQTPRNVLGYQVALSEEGRMVISVIDEAVAVHREITIRSLAGQLGEFEMSTNGESLRVSWNRGVLSLSNSSGEFATVRCDMAAMAFVGTVDSLRLVEHYKPELLTIAMAVTDVTTALGPSTAFTARTEEPDTITSQVAHPILYQDPGDGDILGGSCHGTSQQGWGYDFRKSNASVYATLDVNQKCTNQWCWGCCHLDAVDCVCLVGDAYCQCLRSGVSCGAEDI